MVHLSNPAANEQTHGSPSLRRSSNLPHTDQVASVPSEQSLSVGRPGQGNTIGGTSFTTEADDLWFEFVHNTLGFQIPDLDCGSRCSTEPVTVGTESQGVDHVASLQGVEVLPFVQIPQHGFAVFTA